ncbi:MAG TPA: acireductone synthase [Acidimicrobiales bacterium]|nr:acireductone synthase [Acidimicrobiales bacterium]
MADAIVVDIEGTTSPTAYVDDVMYPYARERFADWVRAHPDDPAVAEVRAAAGDDVAGTLARWSDEDVKATPLKSVQGRIWDAAFAAGELVAPFHPDAVAGLRRWHRAGTALYVFSSGSVTAQRAWFSHSTAGDLSPLVRGWFDTETAGPKKERSSYERISAAIGAPVGSTVFLSDVVAELDAARAAGWRTVGVRRSGDKWWSVGAPGHPEVASFDAVDALLA